MSKLPTQRTKRAGTTNCAGSPIQAPAEAAHLAKGLPELLDQLSSILSVSEL